MHLAIASAFTYPDGGPAAARHRALAAGLTATGHRVTVVLLHQNAVPTELQDGAIDWVEAGEQPASAIGWRLAAARRLRGSLERAGQVDAVDAVLMTTLDPIVMEAGVRAGRALRVPVLHELTEFPDVVAAPGIWGAITRRLYDRRQLPALDGVLVISTALREYVRERTTAPTTLISGIVDLADLPELPPLEMDGTLVVGYAGHLSQAKDGVCDLLRATAAAGLELGGRIRLRVELIGDLQPPPAQFAQRLAIELGLGDQVTFHGRVPHAQVRGLLARCHLLALPRPPSRQAAGGFPTKLGEYLSTGRPVLATGVGDLPMYLRHGDNCVLIPPGDVEALRQSLVDTALDYDRARLLGARGRQLVEREFAAEQQAAKVVSFVAELTAPVAGPR